MVDETQSEMNIGLSEEERDDLENLIRSMRREPPVPSVEDIPPDVRQRIVLLTEHVARLSEMVLKFDVRMKSFYEIIRLFYQKSGKLNDRIDTVVRYLKSMSKL